MAMMAAVAMDLAGRIPSLLATSGYTQARYRTKKIPARKGPRGIFHVWIQGGIPTCHQPGKQMGG